MKFILFTMFITSILTATFLRKSPKSYQKIERRLTTLPDPMDLQFYTTQMQNTHTMMNSLKNQDKRQSELKVVSDQFGNIANKLDDFRETLFRKLGELQMSLERPKVAMSGPGPTMIHPMADPNIRQNTFTNTLSRNFEKRDNPSASGFESNNNNFASFIPGGRNSMAMASMSGPLSLSNQNLQNMNSQNGNLQSTRAVNFNSQQINSLNENLQSMNSHNGDLQSMNSLNDNLQNINSLNGDLNGENSKNRKSKNGNLKSEGPGSEGQTSQNEGNQNAGGVSNRRLLNRPMGF